MVEYRLVAAAEWRSAIVHVHSIQEVFLLTTIHESLPMSIIKSFSVGCGDMFYIKHNSSNFTIIDCCLNGATTQTILNELLREKQEKFITRFISTHPDEDHIHGLSFLNQQIPLMNFYCVANNIEKEKPSDDFKFYCKLRDGAAGVGYPKTIYLTKGMQLKWLNDHDPNVPEDPGPAGINCLWPDPNSAAFQDALIKSANDVDVNNISPIFIYSLKNGVKAMWMGDMEESFQETIASNIGVERHKIDILFAPHHGRKSGKVPSSILDKIQPTIIVIGEAHSEDLCYYSDYATITQNSAKDIVFRCERGIVHVYVGNKTYSLANSCLEKMLTDASTEFGHYIGSFTTKEQ